MRKIAMLTSLLMLSFFSYGQTYQNAIGLKGMNAGGGPFGGGGVNFKTFIGGKNALEFTVGGGPYHISGQALYEWQNPTGWTNGFDWYLGVGPSLGVWGSSDHWHYDDDHDYYKKGFHLGVDGVIGLDFNIKPNTGVPLGFAVDTGPYIGLINSPYFGWGGSIAVRYIIN
ncbi:hypothetical protein [Brumimicrobium sp.]|uniref:hypothetical protein n=1 Tax=Brumimicrobium sp. TaxID=2029867 RepID=UPI003A952082